MVSAIGSANPSYTYQRSSEGGLEAQLARYQKQLSECINCDSYHTPAGKRDAQQLSDKIAQVESKIAQQQNHPSTPAKTISEVASPTENRPVGNLGKNIDVYV